MEKIRILGAPWHVAHQYELLKLAEKANVEFTYLINPYRRWGKTARPMPKHLKWTTHYESGEYDLAILHIDQQCVDPSIGKGKLYRELNEVIQDIPKIVINHGTPMWPESGMQEDMIINGGEIIRRGETLRLEGMKNLIGNNFMIVNSEKAAERWGWGNPIIHGMDPNEWKDLTKEPRAVTMVSPSGLDKYYNRDLMSAVKEVLNEKYGYSLVQITNEYIPVDWDDYKIFLGQALIYVNLTLDSPMPRARTEAMLSGCCILTTKYHGADKFIEQGKNGFIIPNNPEVISQLIAEILNNGYKEAIKIGQEGKETAKKLFNIDRFLQDWIKVINKVLGKELVIWNG